MSQAGILNVLVIDPQIPTQFDTNSGSAIPIGNILEILGDTVANGTYASPLFTTGSGNTVTANVQVGAAITGAPSDKNDAGLVSFDDTMFTVDANGFVQFIGSSGDDTATANYIVDPTGEKAEYTTITAAITAANAAGGGTVFVKPGIYTEDLTLYAGVNIASYDCDSNSKTVKVYGKCTATFSGTASFSGICFETKGANAAIETTGSNAVTLNFSNCNLIGSENGGETNSILNFTNTNASSSYTFLFCTGNLTTTNVRFFNLEKGGLNIRSCYWKNDGSSSLSSLAGNGGTSGNLNILNSLITNHIDISGSSSYSAVNCNFFGSIHTLSCSGSNYAMGNRYENQNIPIIINTPASLPIYNCDIFAGASASYAINGTGTIKYAGLTFSGSKSSINVTTQSIANEGPSRTIGSSNVGGTNALTVTNTDNTNTSSAAKLILSSGGASGGNPALQFTVSGTKNYSMGINNSASSDPFVMTDTTTVTGGNQLLAWTSTTNNYNFGYGLNSNDNAIVIRNTGTTDAGARLTASVGVSSTGDAYISTQIEAVRSYCWGIDNSDSDKLKINTDAAGGVTPSTGTNLYFMTGSGDAAYTNGTGYLQIQSGTTAQRPGTPANGMIRYNTTLNTYEGYQSSGATWLDLAVGGSSPLTTKGDLYTYSTADARLAVGSDGTTLIADSAQTTGNKWGVLQVAGGGTGQSTYTAGDLLYASAANTLSKLSIGAIPGVHLIVNDSGVPQWDTDIVWIYEDFLSTMGPSNGAYRSLWYSGETGSASVTSIDAIDSDHPGCYQLQVSANGDDGLLAKNNPQSAVAENCIKLGGGYLRADYLIKINTLATATEDYVLEVGIGNATQFAPGNDKIYASYDRSTNTNWECITRSGGTPTTGTGGSNVAADTNWTQVTIIVNAGATSVSVYIDGVLVGTSTTNIPTAAITPYIIIRKTATATSVQNNVYWDVFRLYQKLTNSRLS